MKTCHDVMGRMYYQEPECGVNKRVVEKYLKRADEGMKKYGMSLENNHAAMVERITHAQEEAMDLTLYLEWMKDKMIEQSAEIASLKLANSKLEYSNEGSALEGFYGKPVTIHEMNPSYVKMTVWLK